MEHVVVRIGTVRTQVGAVLGKLTELGSHVTAPTALCARFGNGLVYGSFPLKGDAEPLEALTQALTALRGELASTRGYLVVESAPPAFKARFDCWGDVGPQAAVMAGLKRAFDPRQVLNPGRFINHL
jgi:glycolate oxidase FAD binding subunit